MAGQQAAIIGVRIYRQHTVGHIGMPPMTGFD
jgi:hypothetical protein